MDEQPSGINITVSPSQLGGWNPTTVIFREIDTDTVLRTGWGGNLSLPTVDEIVSFGDVTTVAETAEAEPQTTVDMDPMDYEVVEREFTYLYQSSTSSAESSDVEVTVEITLREITGTA